MFRFTLRFVVFAVAAILLVSPIAVGQDGDNKTDEGEYFCELINIPPKVTKLSITSGEDLQNCSLDSSSCAFTSSKLKISVVGEDSENDILLYNYEVDHGKIEGVGPRVDWDLSGLPSGEYSLKVSVDDGVGCTRERFVEKKVILSIDPEAVDFETKDDLNASSKERTVTLSSGWVSRCRVPNSDLPNSPPVTLSFLSERYFVLGCDREACASQSVVQLSVEAFDPENDVLVFLYRTNAGKILGKGKNVKWDLKGAEPGTYTAEVCVDDGSECKDPDRWTKLEVTVR